MLDQSNSLSLRRFSINERASLGERCGKLKHIFLFDFYPCGITRKTCHCHIRFWVFRFCCWSPNFQATMSTKNQNGESSYGTMPTRKWNPHKKSPIGFSDSLNRLHSKNYCIMCVCVCLCVCTCFREDECFSSLTSYGHRSIWCKYGGILYQLSKDERLIDTVNCTRICAYNWFYS